MLSEEHSCSKIQPFNLFDTLSSLVSFLLLFVHNMLHVPEKKDWPYQCLNRRDRLVEFQHPD